MVYYDTVEFRAGTQINHYTLDHPLGRGGQGTVWRAVSPGGVEKAVKLLDLSTLPDTAAERARREARAVRELRDHPAIVPCELLFELPDDVIGLVFELIHGQPLSEVMRDPRMTRDHRSAVLEQIASALAHVHARNLVHRDLKPSNVLVTEAFWNEPRAAGSVKLVDFGIVAPAINRKRITAEGRPVGTPPYLAPELLLPSRWPPPPEAFTQDVFAFGVLGFELLAGAHPTGLSLLAKREAFAAAYQAVDAGRVAWPPTGIKGPLAPILAHCLELDPNARPATGSDLATLLGAELPRSLPRPRLQSRPATATTDAHAPPTDLHAAPRSAVGAYTTSGGMPMPSVRVPPPPPPAPRHVPGNGVRNFFLGALTVALLFTIAFVAWTMGRSTISSPEDATSTLPAPSPSPSPSPVSNVSEPAIKPCCSESGTCKSGWPCRPGDCDAPVPEQWFRLRITGVAARARSDWGKDDSFSDDYAGSHPRARVCIRRAGTHEPAACSPLSMIAAKDGDRIHRARITTADLEQGRLEITVDDNGTPLARGFADRPPGGGYKATALCMGVKLYIGPKETARTRVFAYLDPG